MGNVKIEYTRNDQFLTERERESIHTVSVFVFEYTYIYIVEYVFTVGLSARTFLCGQQECCGERAGVLAFEICS